MWLRSSTSTCLNSSEQNTTGGCEKTLAFLPIQDGECQVTYEDPRHPCRITLIICLIWKHQPNLESAGSQAELRGGVCFLRQKPERSAAARDIIAPEKHVAARASGKVALQRWNENARAIFENHHTGFILLGYLKLIFQSEDWSFGFLDMQFLTDTSFPH